MKKILAGFLVLCSLFFSANFYLRLFQASYDSHASSLFSTRQFHEESTAKKSYPFKLSIKAKHFKRYFHDKNGFYALNFQKIVYVSNCLALMICLVLLLVYFDQILVGLRAPPVKIYS
ncbi:MAG: hypothetical protein AUJ72_03960 [Candidatus Omnitrophica bacterium CG1_02_46_14]|nr:MAG: hypothetical protein AUJ72_03960 [Candidatus Omnitrophica bacterium CG1_02_46_14]